MSVSPDVFLQYLIDSGAFNSYAGQAQPVTQEYRDVLAEVKAHNDAIAVAPVASPVSSGVLPDYGNPDFLAWKSAEEARQGAVYDVGDAYADWVEAGSPLQASGYWYREPISSVVIAPTPVVGLANDVVAPLGLPVPQDYAPVAPAPVAPVLSPVNPVADFANTIATKIESIGRPQVEALGIDSSSLTGQVLSGVLPVLEIAGTATALVGGGSRVVSAVSTPNYVRYVRDVGVPLVTSTLGRTARSWASRAVVMSIVGAGGGLVNLYFAQTASGRPAKTWLNSARTVEYSNVPAEGFRKSKYPDKFGQTCYYRKIG